jgi:hypothetical protein
MEVMEVMGVRSGRRGRKEREEGEGRMMESDDGGVARGDFVLAFRVFARSFIPVRGEPSLVCLYRPVPGELVEP